MKTVIILKCADIMGWCIEHGKENIPADVYDEICGKDRNLVTQELRKYPCIYFACNRVYTVKINDAKKILAYYMKKLE